MLLVLAAALACGPSDSERPYYDDAVTAAVPELIPTDSPAVIIGGRDDRDAYQLSDVVGAVRLSDGRIVVADGQPRLLRYYDAEGAHLRTTGGEGGGRGEFRRINSIARGNADTVVLWDGYQRRISLFAPDGDLASVAGLPAMSDVLARIRKDAPRHIVIPGTVQRLDDGSVVVALLAEPFSESGAPRGLIQDTLPLIALNTSGETGVEIGSFPGMQFFFHEGIGRVIPFGEVRLVAATGDAVFVASSTDRTIRILSPTTGEIVGAIALPGSRRPVSPEDIERTRRRLTEQASGNAARRMVEFVDAIPFPDSLPVLSDLRVGSDQRIWVQLYRAPSDSIQQWLAFAPSGGLQASMTMNPGLQLMDVGEDYVLVLFTDELDVQQIRVYRLVPRR